LVSLSSSDPRFGAPIPTHLLRLPDPILFFAETMLYEDELADNGISLYNIKIRVMPARLLLLGQFFLRLDNVLIRVRDTRVFVEFGTREVVREFTAKEGSYDIVKEKVLSRLRRDGVRDVDVEVGVVMREPGRVVEFLETMERRVETVALPAS
jgi:type 2A phosphatase activator TIP41